MFLSITLSWSLLWKQTSYHVVGAYGALAFFIFGPPELVSPIVGFFHHRRGHRPVRATQQGGSPSKLILIRFEMKDQAHDTKSASKAATKKA